MKINNIIVISDTHFGCKLALCPPKVYLDEGGTYEPSPLQKKLWGMWREFHDKWVPEATRGEPYILVHNGDCIDGVHHNSTTQISHNFNDQVNLAVQVLSPLVERPNCKAYYHIRGTEAHVGKSGVYEEMVAKQLGAIPDDIGNHARWEMWLDLNRHLIHFTHHIGTTGSSAYESTAVHKELVEQYNEAGRWGEQPPDMTVRSHRHRQYEVKFATERHYGISLVTPAWQLKTPFVHKLPGGRASTPQIGGYLIRTGDKIPLYTDFKIWKIERPKREVVNANND